MKHDSYTIVEGSVVHYRHSVTSNLFEPVPLHTHNSCELLFVTKGNLTYMVEGKNYLLSKNSLIISRAGEAHAIIPNEPTEYERYDIIIDETKCGPLFYQMIPKELDVINLNGNELACGLFKKMEYYCQNAEGESLRILLQHLTEELLYNVALISREQGISNTSTANPVITQAIAYINENIMEPLTIEMICKALFITKSHLHRMFLTHLNITPKKYIMVKKLRMAQADLQMGGHPTEVSNRYGFANYATFYRNYKQFFGVVPSEWTDVRLENDALEFM